MRNQLYADPTGLFVYGVVLDTCSRMGEKLAIVDASCPNEPKRISYAEFGGMIQAVARNLVAAGLKPGEVVGIFLPNSWEYAVAFQAISLAGGIPTMLNPAYREREVRYQLDSCTAAMLITDASQLGKMDLSGLPNLRTVFTTRLHTIPGAHPFSSLLKANTVNLTSAVADPSETLAALPFSSGTTGLPKGVMLTHKNLLSNVFQIIAPETAPLSSSSVVLCALPLYHIYGLNVAMNPVFTLGGTLVLMPRFDPAAAANLLVTEGVTMMPAVPAILNTFIQMAEKGQFPGEHSLSWCKSGAAPLAAEIARRFTELTGVKVMQGYGMTEASPVTHIGHLEGSCARADSIGHPVAKTECRVIDINRPGEFESSTGEVGELVVRGPQVMSGYWNAPQNTADVLRDGWYWTGDIVKCDEQGLYYVVDRRKEMIKCKGFPVAPAEVESVLMEHPAVRDCGVIGRPDQESGEVPLAFVVLREGFAEDAHTSAALRAFVADQMASYKQPREIRFVNAIPRTPSGKILRRELKTVV